VGGKVFGQRQRERKQQQRRNQKTREKRIKVGQEKRKVTEQMSSDKAAARAKNKEGSSNQIN